MNPANKNWDLTESQARQPATANVSITPQDGKSKNSQKSDKGDIEKEFWQQWTAMRDRLYRRCLKLMNFNPTDAEDALSRAMLHAWEKVQNYVGTIRNLKGWLMRVTYNFCIDVLRKESRRAVGVEDIEWVGDTGDLGLGSSVESPEMVLEKEERSIEIRKAVDTLPEKMRDTFILHFYSELSHNEIVEKQGISYDCVCKRLSQARKKLKQMLSGYFLVSQVEEGKILQSRPKREERDLPKNRAPIVGWVQCNGTQHMGIFKNCQSQRPLRGSPKELIGYEMASFWGETEDAFVDAVAKPEMVENPVESRERVEVMIPDAVTVSAEVDVDVAECLESVEVVGVSGENELRPILPGVLSPLSLELTWRRDVWEFAPLSEWGREVLAGCLIGEVVEPENSFGHKGAVGNWWRGSGGRVSSILEMVGVVIRKFFDVPDYSRSLSRFLVKGNFDGERRRWVMGARLVGMVGAIGFKHPRQDELRRISINNWLGEEKRRYCIRNARGPLCVNTDLFFPGIDNI